MSSQQVDPLGSHPKYQKIKDLNSGSFGVVQLALDKTTNEKVALKFIERSKVTKYAEHEILNHRQLVHPHIIQFKEAFLTKTHLCITMEYAPGGDLLDYVTAKGRLSESEARWFFQQLIVAVDYMHRMGIVSRDIKLENTLLDGSTRPLIKLCDFGYSKHDERQSAPGSRVGTPAYLPPEIVVLSGKTYDGKLADIWCCGVMLFVMLTAEYPFERPGDEGHPQLKLQKTIQRILRVDYVLPPHLGPELRDLMGRILVADPAKRITIEEILDHPWYNKELPYGAKQMNDAIDNYRPDSMEVE